MPELEMKNGRLKILHLASHHGVFRGGAVQLCRMALEQHRRGHMVHAIAFSGEPDLSSEEISGARNSWNPLKDAGILVSFMDYSSLAGLWNLRRHIRRHGYDAVHVHRDEALLAAWWALWGLRRPALVAQRGTITPSERLARRALASARVQKIIAVSEAVQQAVGKSAGPVALAKTKVVYGSVDLQTFAPRPVDMNLKEKIGCPADSIIIGSLSAYRRAKGFDVLIKALSIAFKEHPRVHAVFLGKDVEENVGPLAEELGIATRCHFMGHQSNVADWLSIMDITAIAADKREGLSGVLRESLAMEVPVISTDCAGNREIVRNRETGLLVPAKNPQALGQALLWALDHPEAMKGTAQAGRRWVVENCSMEIQGGRLEAIYRSIINER